MKYLLLLLLLLISCRTAKPRAAGDVTRLYFSERQATQATVTANAQWNTLTDPAAYMIYRIYSNASTGKVSANQGAAAPRKTQINTYVSPPLIGQTLNCNINGQIRFNQTNAVGGAVFQGFIIVRLLNPDFTLAAELGTIGTSNLVVTTLTNKTLIPLTLSNITITAGQRLCFEIGVNFTAGTTGAVTGRYGNQSTTTGDLPIDETTTAALAAWIEFSQVLKFQTTNILF